MEVLNISQWTNFSKFPQKYLKESSQITKKSNSPFPSCQTQRSEPCWLTRVMGGGDGNLLQVRVRSFVDRSEDPRELVVCRVALSFFLVRIHTIDHWEHDTTQSQISNFKLEFDLSRRQTNGERLIDTLRLEILILLLGSWSWEFCLQNRTGCSLTSVRVTRASSDPE